jgi:hypothetical protein
MHTACNNLAGHVWLVGSNIAGQCRRKVAGIPTGNLELPLRLTNDFGREMIKEALVCFVGRHKAVAGRALARCRGAGRGASFEALNQTG